MQCFLKACETLRHFFRGQRKGCPDPDRIFSGRKQQELFFFDGCLENGGPLFGRHRLKGPLAADASAFGALLFEELEHVGWQFLHCGES